jgi:hypothetical protein
MIPLTTEHYAAIGKIAVQSGILERELLEYIANLAPNAKFPYGLRPKLEKLRSELAAATANPASLKDLENLLDKILELVLQRNTVVHGVWEADTLAPHIREESLATGDVQVRAREAASVAHSLRNARMLLLHLLHDHCPYAATGRDRPKSEPAKLKIQLGL